MKIDFDSVPSTFDEAVNALEGALTEESRQQILGFKGPEEAAIATHHDLGRWLRNNWGLWDTEDTPLRLDVRRRFCGLAHPDDVSGLVLSAFTHRVWNVWWDVDTAVRKKLEHWDRYGYNSDGSTRKVSP